MPLFVCNMPLLVSELPKRVYYALPKRVYYDLPKRVFYDLPKLVQEMLIYELPLLVNEMLIYELPFLALIILIMDSASIYVKITKNVMFRCLCGHKFCSCALYNGGYKLCLATYADVKDYILEEHCTNLDLNSSL